MVGFTFASIFHTQVILYELSLLDINITLTSRLSTTYLDAIGLLPKYGSVLTVVFFIAFVIAGVVKKRFTLASYPIYTIAGAIAMLSVVISMQQLLGLTFLASTRELYGVLLQTLSGAIAGASFSYLSGKFDQH